MVTVQLLIHYAIMEGAQVNLDPVKMRLCFMDKQGRILCDKKLTALPLREEAIIAKSMEFYDDPEPCMIHRSAVMKRLFCELGEFISNHIQKGDFRLNWDSIPENIRKYIDIGDEVMEIDVY